MLKRQLHWNPQETLQHYQTSFWLWNRDTEPSIFRHWEDLRCVGGKSPVAGLSLSYLRKFSTRCPSCTASTLPKPSTTRLLGHAHSAALAHPVLPLRPLLLYPHLPGERPDSSCSLCKTDGDHSPGKGTAGITSDRSDRAGRETVEPLPLLLPFLGGACGSAGWGRRSGHRAALVERCTGAQYGQTYACKFGSKHPATSNKQQQ